MSLSFDLPTEKEFTASKPFNAGSKVKLTKVHILRIVDIPSKKTVAVVVKDLGRVKIANLSDGNYNNPPWTDQAIIDNLSAQLSA